LWDKFYLIFYEFTDSSEIYRLLKAIFRLKLKYMVIHKSVKYFKNSQQIDCATDRGNSYADRERNSPGSFKGKTCAHNFPELPLGQSQRTRFLRIPKHKMTAHVY
jgi:hypothetical protein